MSTPAEILFWAIEHPWIWFGSNIFWAIILGFLFSGNGTKTKRNKLSELALDLFCYWPGFQALIFALALIQGLLEMR